MRSHAKSQSRANKFGASVSVTWLPCYLPICPSPCADHAEQHVTKKAGDTIAHANRTATRNAREDFQFYCIIN